MGAHARLKLFLKYISKLHAGFRLVAKASKTELVNLFRIIYFSGGPWEKLFRI